MGHEAILYGCIEGATWRSGANYDRLQTLNREALDSLPDTDDWPFLVRGMFSTPELVPYGRYRSQVIHFGGSLKEDATVVPHVAADEVTGWAGVWVSKFEAVLRRLHWFSAVAHMHGELMPELTINWQAVPNAGEEPPAPTTLWRREVLLARDGGCLTRS